MVLLAVFLASVLAQDVAQDTIRVDLPLEAKTPGPWHLAKALVEIPRGAVGPKLKLAPQPTQPKAPAPDSFVSVTFEINEKGLPVNIQVEKSSDKELEEEVIALIREWRFEAVLMGDVPVVTHAHVDLAGSDPSAAVVRQRPVPHHRPSPAQ